MSSSAVDRKGIKFYFEIEVEIPENEIEEFLVAFKNKHFDFFRYLANNQATINKKYPRKEWLKK